MITEDLDAGESPEPIELGRSQITALVDLLASVEDGPLVEELHAGCERYTSPG